MKTLLLATVAAFSLAGAAMAQPPAAEQAPAAAPTNATVSDDEVRKVAALVVELKTITETHQPKVAAAAEGEAKAAAEKAMYDEIRAALDKHGVTIDRYNAIAAAAQSDSALAARLAAATPGNSASTEPATNDSVSDDEVRKVASLVVELRTISETHQPKVAAAEGDAKAAAEKAMYDEIRAALDKHGMSIDRYNAIAQAAQSDQALAARLTAAGSSANAATGSE